MDSAGSAADTCQHLNSDAWRTMTPWTGHTTTTYQLDLMNKSARDRTRPANNRAVAAPNLNRLRRRFLCLACRILRQLLPSGPSCTGCVTSSARRSATARGDIVKQSMHGNVLDAFFEVHSGYTHTLPHIYPHTSIPWLVGRLQFVGLQLLNWTVGVTLSPNVRTFSHVSNAGCGGCRSSLLPLVRAGPN